MRSKNKINLLEKRCLTHIFYEMKIHISRCSCTTPAILVTDIPSYKIIFILLYHTILCCHMDESYVSSHNVCHEVDGFSFFSYSPFWALVSPLSITPQCICWSLMFSCTKLCTTTEFMLFFSPSPGKGTANYVLRIIMYLLTCNIFCYSPFSILQWILKTHILHHGGLSHL